MVHQPSAAGIYTLSKLFFNVLRVPPTCYAYHAAGTLHVKYMCTHACTCTGLLHDKLLHASKCHLSIRVTQRLGMLAGVAFSCDLQTIEEWTHGAWSARGRPQDEDLILSWYRLLQLPGRRPYSLLAAHRRPGSCRAGV